MEIYKNNLIHRDLKPQNIFINENYIIKIGDFGISKQITDNSKAKTDIGTQIYYAPERLDEGEYDNKVDIWALGCIIYELYTLRECFPTRCFLCNAIKDKKTYGKIDLKYYNRDLQNIIDKLLEANPNNRSNIEKVFYLIQNCNNNFILDNKSIKSLDESSYNIFKSHNVMVNFEDNSLLPKDNEDKDNDNLKMELTKLSENNI